MTMIFTLTDSQVVTVTLSMLTTRISHCSQLDPARHWTKLERASLLRPDSLVRVNETQWIKLTVTERKNKMTQVPGMILVACLMDYSHPAKLYGMQHSYDVQ